MTVISGFTCIGETGFPVICDAWGNNVAFCRIGCSLPSLQSLGNISVVCRFQDHPNGRRAAQESGLRFERRRLPPLLIHWTKVLQCQLIE